MKLILHEVALPLRHTFTIARGSTSVQRALVVELVDGSDRGSEHGSYHGYGEATESVYYGTSAQVLRTALEPLRADIESLPPGDPRDYWARWDPLIGQCRFAQAALDAALHDLWGNRLGQPLWRQWGLDLSRAAYSDYTIGIDSIERMIVKLEEFADWPAFKVKLGTPDDLAIVRALREHTQAPLRVDANCSWTVEETLSKATELKALGVELIEQPLPPADWSGARRLLAESPVPIFADESCQSEADVERCAGHFHGINIKLQKCGGLTPARRMIDHARRLGLRVMIGCMNESTVGISAAAQLLPLADYADLDGAVLLARDIATGVRIERGVAVFPDAPGCGIRWLA
jgi:L-alanine-DL-glutamate epimerase-like enolase superfamily enzyme